MLTGGEAGRHSVPFACNTADKVWCFIFVLIVIKVHETVPRPFGTRELVGSFFCYQGAAG